MLQCFQPEMDRVAVVRSGPAQKPDALFTVIAKVFIVKCLYFEGGRRFPRYPFHCLIQRFSAQYICFQSSCLPTFPVAASHVARVEAIPWLPSILFASLLYIKQQ